MLELAQIGLVALALTFGVTGFKLMFGPVSRQRIISEWPRPRNPVSPIVAPMPPSRRRSFELKPSSETAANNGG